MLPNLAQLSNVPIGHLLIVDDEENNRVLLRDILEVHGHTVTEAASGPDALRVVKENVPDAILSDVCMPGMDGYEVCRKIKENPAAAHVPVLLITALTDRKDRLAGIQAGASDFITKPIDIAEVTLRVRNAVQTKKLFDSLEAAYQQSIDVHALQQKIVQIIIRETRTPLSQALETLEPQRSKAAKNVALQKALDQACKILQDLSKRFDQLTAGAPSAPTVKAA